MLPTAAHPPRAALTVTSCPLTCPSGAVRGQPSGLFVVCVCYFLLQLVVVNTLIASVAGSTVLCLESMHWAPQCPTTWHDRDDGRLFTYFSISFRFMFSNDTNVYCAFNSCQVFTILANWLLVDTRHVTLSVILITLSQ